MKNIGMKKNINEQREGIWGESLKSLKSLMQIFAESANSAKQIFATFATFATFAMQIFSNLVNMVKTVMQIFAKGEYSAVRVSSVQQPTNIQRISNLSLTMSTVKVAQKSRIRPILPLFATVLMMLGFGVQEAWGERCYEAEFLMSDDGHDSGDIKGGTIYTTPVLSNTDGIDTIWFEYKIEDGWYEKKIQVQYSTSISGEDFVNVGSSKDNNHTSWRGRTGNGDNIFVVAPDDKQKTIKRIRFVTDGSNSINSYHYYIRKVQIRKCSTLKINNLSSTSHTFTETAVDASKIQTFTISTWNIDATPTITKSGTNASYFGFSLSAPSDDCPKTRTLTITYTPGAETVGEAKHSATVTVSAAGKSATLTVYGTAREIADVTYTWNNSAPYYVGDVIDLTEAWTSSNVEETPEYSIESYTSSTGTNNEGATAPTIVDGHYLHLNQACDVTLAVHQDAITGYAEGNDTKTITVSKRTPTFTWNTQAHYYYNSGVSPFVTKTSGGTYTVTSNNTEVVSTSGDNVTIYNKPGTASIRVHHPETYYWEEYDHSESITPEWKSNHVTLEVTESNYTSVIENRYAGESDRFRWLNGGVLLGSQYVAGDGAEGWDSRYIDIHFTGMPDSLSFTYERSVSTATGMDWWVKEKTEDGEWGDETIYHPNGNPASGTCKVPLKPNTRWVRLRGYCNYGVYFRNIKITKREQFETDSTSFDFKTQIKNANVPSKSFKFKHANAGYTVTAASNDSHYKVSLNNSDFYSSIIIPNTGGDRMDSSVVYVKYYPSIAGDVEETHNATITFSDALSNSATVSLTGKTQAKLETHLEYIGSDSYSVNADNIAATTLFEVRDANNALVASPVIKLTSSDSTKIDIVHVDGKDYADFLCGADNVRITAIYAGDDDYAAASNSGTFYHDIDVIKPNDVVTWNMPTAEDGTIHIKAKHDVPYSIATANTAIRFTTRNAAQLTVNAGPTIDTLRTVAHSKTPVWLVATTAGSCAYNSIKDSIQITVEPCYHEIIWNQTFAGLTTAEDGTISEEYDLNAYAVDSNGVATNIDIIYSMPSVSFATLEGSHLTISGIGETTITATTDDDSKFATVVYPKALKIRRYGEECESNALPGSVSQQISF